MGIKPRCTPQPGLVGGRVPCRWRRNRSCECNRSPASVDRARVRQAFEWGL